MRVAKCPRFHQKKERKEKYETPHLDVVEIHHGIAICTLLRINVMWHCAKHVLVVYDGTWRPQNDSQKYFHFTLSSTICHKVSFYGTRFEASRFSRLCTEMLHMHLCCLSMRTVPRWLTQQHCAHKLSHFNDSNA